MVAKPQQPANLRQAIDQQAWESVPTVIKNTLVNIPDNQKTSLLIKMGGMLRQVHQNELATQCLLQAIDFAYNTILLAQCHEQLSSIYKDLEDFTAAKQHGDIALQLNDLLAERHKPKKNLIAFSLFGSNPVYCETAIVNAQCLPEIYPDWQMAVYHDDTVPSHVINRLQKLNVETIDIKTLNASHMPGTFWRFLALERSEFAAVILRDADSVISEREKVLVDAWLASDKPFHVIRDWYGHTDLILAGLWGVKMGFLAGIRGWIEDYLHNTPKLHPTHADQYFLAQYVWSRIKPFTLHHSSVYDFEGASWVDSLPTVNYLADGKSHQLGAWLTTIYKVDVASDYLMMLKDKDTTICHYQFKQGQTFELPRSYRHKIDSGEWTLQIIPISIDIQHSSS